jgi:hypothetical protein
LRLEFVWLRLVIMIGVMSSLVVLDNGRAGDVGVDWVFF